MKLFNYRPLMFIALSLISGAVFTYVCFYYSIPALAVFSAIIISFGVYAFIKDSENKRRNIICICVCLMFFAFGALSLFSRIQTVNSFNVESNYYDFSGYVCSKTEDNGTFLYELEDAELSRDYKIKGVKLSFCDTQELQIGDKVKGYAYAQFVDIKGNGYINNAPIVDGPTYDLASVQNLEVVDNEVRPLSYVSLQVLKKFKKYMQSDAFPIAYALCCGDSSFMPDEVKGVYRFAGIAHIFAVSGLHIGFLCGMLTLLLRKYKNRYAKTAIISCILIFYAGVCGFRPSSVRAVIMCITAMLFSVFGGKNDFISSISLSATVILLLDIGNLFDVGFQLSFVSVVGIAILYPALCRINKLGGKTVSSAVNLSLSASLATLPIALLVFERVSVAGVVFNLLLVPVVSIIFYMLFAITALSFIFPFLSYCLVVPGFGIKIINYVLNVTDLSVFYVRIKANLYFALAYYLAFFTASDLINLSVKKKCIFGTIFLISSVMCLIF